MIRPVAENLWVCDMPLSFGPLHLGARATIVRLPSGGLAVHSPVRFSDEEHRALAALGPVRFILAPNLGHHLHAGALAERHPEAQLWGVPGLAEKRADLRFTGRLGVDPLPDELAAALDAELLAGMPKLNEVVFLHRESRSLIVSDLAFYGAGAEGVVTRLYFRLSGCAERPAPTAIFKWMVKDRAALRTSIDRVLGWDFDRVVICHGAIAERGGKDALRDGFAWLRS